MLKIPIVCYNIAYIFEKQALQGYQIRYWEVCLGHQLGHRLGHVWGMSGASSGACLVHYLGQWGSLRYQRCYMHLWCLVLVLKKNWFFSPSVSFVQAIKTCTSSFQHPAWGRSLESHLIDAAPQKFMILYSVRILFIKSTFPVILKVCHLCIMIILTLMCLIPVQSEKASNTLMRRWFASSTCIGLQKTLSQGTSSNQQTKEESHFLFLRRQQTFCFQSIFCFCFELKDVVKQDLSTSHCN